jgi:eukaryotic-like serine/threonine-protein kinase
VLGIGHRLGPYEILSVIGAGGMGEVYRAKDTRLDRTVAIKVLPEHLSADESLRARFEREAKAVSQLNHPNICTLHDVGHHNGTHYLILEYLDGESLSARLRRGPIPRSEMLRYSVHIANALDRAHLAGIIHRDLKPGNIMITKSGAKLLDFGIATISRPESNLEDSSIQKAKSDLTTQGLVLGTPQYMSPEQIEGKRVDFRSDIFSFGSVMYEMATGKKAFEGDTQARLIAAILKEEPKPISEYQPLAPPALDSLVRTCLAKDPEDRWQNVRDISTALKWILNTTTSAIEPVSSGFRWRRFLWLAAGLIIGSLIVGLLLWKPEPTPIKRNVVRFAIPLPTIDRLAGLDIAISPDGRKLVYSASSNELQQLFLRPIDQLKSIPIEGTEGARYPFFSPDGLWLGFFADNAVKKVLLPGGEPITICMVSDSRFEIGASWGTDDMIIFGLKGEGLQRVSAKGGNPEKVAQAPSDEAGRWFSNPQCFDGKHIFATLTSGTSIKQQLALIDLQNGKSKVLLDGGNSALLPSGELIYEIGTALYAVRFDMNRLEAVGRSVSVLEGKDEIYADSRTFVVGNNGTLVYVPLARSEVKMLSVDRTGQATPVLSKIEMYRYPRFSPDGKRIAVAIRSPSGGDVWLIDSETGSRSRLTVEGANAYPVWTPDGSRVAFTSSRQDAETSGIYWTLTDGSGTAELLLKGQGKNAESLAFAGSFSPDGNFLAYRENHSATGEDIFVLSITDRKVIPFAATKFTELAPSFSPDGNWIAYQSDESGQDQVYVRAFPGGGAKIPISTEGGRAPIWSKDGHELFYRHGNSVQAVQITLQPKFTASQPQLLFEGLYEAPSTGGNPYYDISPDGKRFVMLQSIDPASQKQLQVVLNWDEEVKQLLHAGK